MNGSGAPRAVSPKNQLYKLAPLTLQRRFFHIQQVTRAARVAPRRQRQDGAIESNREYPDFVGELFSSPAGKYQAAISTH